MIMHYLIGSCDRAIIHFHPDGIVEVIKLYAEMMSWIASEMSKILIKYNGRTINLSNKSDAELIIAVDELYRFWRKCTYTIQAAILQNLTVYKVKELVVMNNFVMEAESGTVLYGKRETHLIFQYYRYYLSLVSNLPPTTLGIIQVETVIKLHEIYYFMV